MASEPTSDKVRIKNFLQRTSPLVIHGSQVVVFPDLNKVYAFCRFTVLSFDLDHFRLSPFFLTCLVCY